MNDFFQKIVNILIDLDIEINEKIVGINLLEKIKYILINKLKTLDGNTLEKLNKNEIDEKNLTSFASPSGPN